MVVLDHLRRWRLIKKIFTTMTWEFSRSRVSKKGFRACVKMKVLHKKIALDATKLRFAASWRHHQCIFITDARRSLYGSQGCSGCAVWSPTPPKTPRGRPKIQLVQFAQPASLRSPQPVVQGKMSSHIII